MFTYASILTGSLRNILERRMNNELKGEKTEPYKTLSENQRREKKWAKMKRQMQRKKSRYKHWVLIQQHQ